MVGWHHWLHGHEFQQVPEDAEGQGRLIWCSPWGCKELDMIEWLSNNNWQYSLFLKCHDSPAEQSSSCLFKIFNNGIDSSLKNVILLQVHFLPREWMFQGLSSSLVYLNGSYVKCQSGNRGILKFPRMCISFTHLSTRKILYSESMD